MTILDLLTKAGLAGYDLLAFLVLVGQKVPDLKPKTDEWAAKLGAALSPEGLAALGQEVIKELGDFAKHGITEPRSHPSDIV